MLNAVTEPEGVGSAVLIRALEPLDGIEAMRERRGLDPVLDLCSGPGKLTQALGIELDLNDTPLDGPVSIHPRSPGEQSTVEADMRIGINVAVELPWRFCESGSRFLSRPVRRR